MGSSPPFLRIGSPTVIQRQTNVKANAQDYITKSNDNININSRIELQTDKQTLKQMLRIRLHKPYLNLNVN
jgi:hypothetical protein